MCERWCVTNWCVKDGAACVTSATPATQSDGGCYQVPRLPRKGTMDVTKCHACHANRRGDHRVHCGPSAPPEPVQCHKCHRKVTMDVSKCHACHAKGRWMSPSATPATPTAAATHQVPRLPHHRDGGCHQVPRQPRKRQRRSKCHTCNAK